VAAARLVAKGDPNREAVLASLHHAIGELPEGAVVLAEDETHINLLPWVRATWIANGTRQQVMTPGTNRRRTIFGAVDLNTGRWFYQVARKAVSATFIAFLDQLAAGYPAAPTVAVVCDNVIIHHSKIVQRWLAAHPRVVVLHGARYSPHDNPVERIWGALKAWLATSPTLTIQGRLRQVHAFFRQRSPTQILATAAPVQLTVDAQGLHAELPGGRLGSTATQRCHNRSRSSPTEERARTRRGCWRANRTTASGCTSKLSHHEG
jgi:transposase